MEHSLLGPRVFLMPCIVVHREHTTFEIQVSQLNLLGRGGLIETTMRGLGLRRLMTVLKAKTAARERGNADL